jgi:uncharacterized protein YciI
MHWLLLYDYVEDIVERRAPHRPAHLALVRELRDQGVVLMAGALGDPVDGAAFVFRSDDRAAVEDFLARDPNVKEGLVTGSAVRPWTVVTGGP